MNDDRESYCREVEAYLCRKNDGHLIRIVGPAFEQVCGWAARGIPIKIVFRGIDRYFERYYAKGPRRRPVRVEFCEADVLDVFDEWRRAVGVHAARAQPSGSADAAQQEARQARATALHTHIERAVSRLLMVRSGVSDGLHPVIDDTIRELDLLRARAKGARGDARVRLIERLAWLDGELLRAARSATAPATLEGLASEARTELEPFRDRMPAEAFERSLTAAIDRLLRERLGLPALTPEA